MEDNSKPPEEANLCSYFQQNSSSVFDQLSPDPLGVNDASSTALCDDSSNSETKIMQSETTLKNEETVSNDQNIGYKNPVYSLEMPINTNSLQPNPLESPQPAVLTPGVAPVPSQASTPFKEIDPSQVAMLSSQPESNVSNTINTPGFQNYPQSMKDSKVSPNTCVDLESTIVKFSQATLYEEPSNETNITSNIPKAYVAPPKSLSSTTSGFESNADKSNLSSYFSAPKSSFEASRNINQSNTSLSESAMMNPVYMSPTDNFNISTAIPSPDSFLTPATEQDVFTASLLSSDADRRHDAWIPSDATKNALLSMSSSPPGTYFPEKDLMTMPGIAVKEDFGDPVKNLVRTYLGEEAAAKRHVLTASSVTQDDRGVRQLIAAGCYHAAVNLTTQLLTVYGQGEGRAGHPSKHTAHSIQLWFTRLALLIKLRRFSLAEVECQHFKNLDAPDLYFQFYPELYGGRKGSMVPFSFRILVAELPQYLGKHTQALDRLNTILRTCDQILSNLSSGLSEDGSNFEMSSTAREDSLKLWKTRRIRVLYCITSCAAGMKDFRLAGGLIHKLLHQDQSNVGGLYSALGRLCLQLGDINAAQEAFEKYLENSPPPPQHDPVQGLLHSAYICCAQNNFKDAMQVLQQAHKLNPNNGLVVSNLGVCLMYIGEVREAIKVVESAVFSQPDRFLHEAVVLNLATMYELESSSPHDNKLKLLSLVSQYKGDSFNVAALKLQQQL